MSPNPEMGRTQKDIKNPEGRTMVERVQARLEAEKNDIRDFFHTNKGESEVLMTSDLEALGYNEENFELSKQVYGEMAMEELDKFASGDELARSLLKKRVERIQDMMDYGSAWHAMQRLSPKWMAKVATK